jgi:hypothetical protein
VTRAWLPALGYVYVGLALPALILAVDHPRAVAALLTGAAFCYLWFIASLRARVVRFDPDGFFAGAVTLGAGAFLVLQTLAVTRGDTAFAAPSSACAATVIIASSMAAWRARKIARWFGQAGIAGGIAVLIVGMIEGAADWTFAGDAVFASSLGFMLWVVITATYLLRR